MFSKGKSWTHPERTELPNDNAAIQATVLSNNNVVICFNPTNGPRDIMRIAVSEDGGKTWPHYKVSLNIVAYPCGLCMFTPLSELTRTFLY